MNHFTQRSACAEVPIGYWTIFQRLPALVYLRLLGPLRSVIAGVLQATSLTFIVAATQIGLGLDVVSRASAAALVAAGLLSVANHGNAMGMPPRMGLPGRKSLLRLRKMTGCCEAGCHAVICAPWR